MAFSNNTITNPDPSGQLIAAIEAMMLAHSNWDQIETGLVIGGSTFNVWRNNGSGPGANSFGQNFYLAFEKQSVTAFRFRPFEAYTLSGGTPANARMIHPCVQTSSSLAAQSDSSFGLAAGYALNDTSNAGYMGPNALPTTGFEYWIILSNDYLRVGVRAGATDMTWEVGLFDSVLSGVSPALAEPFPLYMSYGNSSGTSSSFTDGTSGVAVSRMPMPDTTARTSTWRYQWSGTSNAGPMIGGPGDPTNYDRYQGANVILVGRPWIEHVSSPASTFGSKRGRAKDLLLVNNSGATARVGDTYPIGADTYYCWRYNSNGYCYVKRDVA